MSLAVRKILGYAATGLGPFKGGTISQASQGTAPTGSNNFNYTASNWQVLTNNITTGTASTQTTEWVIMEENPSGSFFGPPVNTMIRARGSNTSQTRTNGPWPYYGNNWCISVPPGVYMLTWRWPSNETNTYNRWMFQKLLAYSPADNGYIPVFKTGLCHAVASVYEAAGGFMTVPLYLPRSLAVTSGAASGYVELLPLICVQAAFYWDRTYDDFQHASLPNLTKIYMQLSFMQLQEL